MEVITDPVGEQLWHLIIGCHVCVWVHLPHMANDAGVSQFEPGCKKVYKTLALLNIIILIFDRCMGQFLF